MMCSSVLLCVLRGVARRCADFGDAEVRADFKRRGALFVDDFGGLWLCRWRRDPRVQRCYVLLRIARVDII